MKAAPFRYHAPTALDEALRLLAEVAPEDGRIIAGGQSLIPAMALRIAQPPHLVDINRIAALGDTLREPDALVVRACVRHAAFERAACADPLDDLLATVARQIAHGPIRVRGTFCGSLANADPASEWCLVAATLGATMLATSTRGERAIAAADWFRGVMTTALEPDELLRAVRLPSLAPDERYGFWKFSRRIGDFALGMVLACYRVENGRIAAPRIGIGAIEPSPRRIAEAEAALAGQSPGAAAFAAAADASAAAVDPLDDGKTTPHYRRDLVRAGVLRALRSAR